MITYNRFGFVFVPCKEASENIISRYRYVVCLKSKCTDFLFNYLLDLLEITSYLLRSMTLGKLHSSTGSHFL